ncbi:dihydropyrimidinase [Clostridium pasteurianum]|uniref:D-hydantoinase n=1 Tax=Clostridium pasteurianum BC1 TaxID=86416 RepID=R4K157_CLOPA|nr:dihydropyrimidinase [Clostridium pasteurianum]AGK95491.1 D-hydantoinase [Clostridium pasteurianum BC1]
MSVLIKNGTIIAEDKELIGDIYIENSIISEIGVNINKTADEIIDASDKFVVPGGIDAHTHLNIHMGDIVAKDDFYTGTEAAACGGTTSIIDHMGFGPKGCDLHHQLKVYHEYAQGNSVIDYSFHGVIQHVNENILEEMEDMVAKEGISSFKIYLTYDNKVNDEEALKVLIRLKELGAITTVHCENDGVINYFRKLFIKEGKIAPIYHALSRPEESEAEAVNRMISLASVAGNAPLYIVHVSCEKSMEHIIKAQQEGKNVIAETCPQYLFLDQDKYREKDMQGLKYIMSPPLREKENQNLLWNDISNNNIQVVATDHCPFDFKGDKQRGKDDFTKCPNGAPGIETRIPLLFSEGVMKGKIDIRTFVDMVSTNPAKIFGLYPKKGVINVGADADIVIIDKNREVTLSKAMLHENVDYTPYEGMKLKGYPVLTMVRGTVIARDNVFTGEKGYGEFLSRGKASKNK